MVQAARHYAQDVVLRLTRARARKLAGRRLRAGTDLAVTWTPSAQDQLHPQMSAAPVAGRVLYVRLTRPGFRPVELYLFTTLRDATEYPLEDLVELYGQRGHVELNLRYVKDTLDMALLWGKTSAMVRKELHAGLIAYNLIRGYMAQAALAGRLSPLRLSFSRSWRRVREVWLSWRPTDTRAYTQRRITRLLRRLAQCRLPHRPRFRLEPRAVRGRPRAAIPC